MATRSRRYKIITVFTRVLYLITLDDIRNYKLVMIIDILSLTLLNFIFAAMKKFIELINFWHTNKFVIKILNNISDTYSLVFCSCKEVSYHLIIRWRIKSRSCMRVTLLHSTILFSMLSSRKTMDLTIRRWRVIRKIVSLGRIFSIFLFCHESIIKSNFELLWLAVRSSLLFDKKF